MRNQGLMDLFRLVIILFLAGYVIQSCTQDADAAEDILPKCQSALSACDAALTAEKAASEKLQQQVVVLKDSEKQWRKRAEAPKDAPVCLAAVAAGTIGGGLGGYVSENSSGMAKGAMVGGLVGLTACLLFGGAK